MQFYRGGDWHGIMKSDDFGNNCELSSDGWRATRIRTSGDGWEAYDSVCACALTDCEEAAGSCLPAGSVFWFLVGVV